MLRVVYEDDHVVVIDKPSGMLTHPTAHARGGTALDAVRAWLGTGADPRPAHRLDRGTSGALLFAKTARAHVVLMRHFAERRVRKAYVAIVRGTLAGPCEVTAPIARVDGRWVATPDGRAAHSTITPIEADGSRTRLALVPHTGRTHQLRIHCAALGVPIVGDPEHDPAAREVSARLHLHAAHLAFLHPHGGGLVTCDVPAPDGWSWSA